MVAARLELQRWVVERHDLGRRQLEVQGLVALCFSTRSFSALPTKYSATITQLLLSAHARLVHRHQHGVEHARARVESVATRSVTWRPQCDVAPPQDCSLLLEGKLASTILLRRSA